MLFGVGRDTVEFVLQIERASAKARAMGADPNDVIRAAQGEQMADPRRRAYGWWLDEILRRVAAGEAITSADPATGVSERSQGQ